MSRAIKSRPVIFGEVLFDRFPDGNAILGGAPFNVAWNLQALGAAPLLVSRVGQDDLGDRIAAAMDAWQMDRSGLQRDSRHSTGTVEITIREGEPNYDIALGKAYDFIAAADMPPAPQAGVLYHGSLVLRSEPPRQALARLRQETAAPLFMDVNLRAPWWQAPQVRQWLSEARWVKLNEAELAELFPDQPDIPGRAERLLTSTEVQGLIVTRGEKGVWFRDRQGLVLEPQGTPAAQVVDTVGAGDAFSSVVILGLLADWPWPVILERALAFAAGVVGLRGATTTDQKFYEPFTRSWELS